MATVERSLALLAGPSPLVISAPELQSHKQQTLGSFLFGSLVWVQAHWAATMQKLLHLSVQDTMNCQHIPKKELNCLNKFHALVPLLWQVALVSRPHALHYCLCSSRTSTHHNQTFLSHQPQFAGSSIEFVEVFAYIPPTSQQRLCHDMAALPSLAPMHALLMLSSHQPSHAH